MQYKTKWFKYRILKEDYQDTHQLFIKNSIIQVEFFTLDNWLFILGIATKNNLVTLVTPSFNLTIAKYE